MIKLLPETYQAFDRTPNPRLALHDYLECYVLDKIFQNDYFRRNFVFSGGATLTKSYQISSRIGRDLDLSLINFTDLSSGRTKRQLNNFKKTFKTFTFSNIYSKLDSIINHDEMFDIITDRDWPSPENTGRHASSPALHLLYHSEYGDGHLCIEISARKYRSGQISYRGIVPYSLPQSFAPIPTVAYQQTFWDKVFALHSNALSRTPHVDKSYSRHYCDVALLSDFTDLERTHHMLSDTISYQKIHTTKIIPLQHARDVILIPDDKTLYQLSDDYYAMSGTFTQPQVSWNTIVQRLQTLTQDLKQL